MSKKTEQAREAARQKKKKLLLISAIAALLLIAAAAGLLLLKSKTESAPSAEAADASGCVKLTVKDFGDIVIKLDPDAAPLTVANFRKLVSEHFYDGLTFHRVYPGFMIQGGDPEGTGNGGSPDKIKGEFSANGVDNPLSHKRGVVSMARASYSMDSASSQFFICQQDSTFLDGQYAAFGEVVSGMEVVDAICEIDLEYNSGGELSKPLTPVVIVSAELVEP